MVKFVHKSKDFFLFCLALDTDLEIFPLKLFLLCSLHPSLSSDLVSASLLAETDRTCVLMLSTQRGAGAQKGVGMILQPAQ